ncbi:MAG TPA: CHAD domain-containing protein [Thermodesulfobacteriota bacterium]|nr:CHAD domain-containing protein [Thermodesulfobacteriota bacterium]
MQNSQYFVLEDGSARDDVLERMKNGLPLTGERKAARKQLFLDTYDHRLYKKGFLLTNEDGRLILRDTGDGSCLSLDVHAEGGMPRFCWDLPECPFRDNLRSVIDVRALLPVVGVESRVTHLNLENEDGKTVAHINFEDVDVGGDGADKKVIHLLEAVPVRGYAEEFEKLTLYISDLGLAPAEGNMFSIALGAAGKKAGDYTSKVSVVLDTGMPSGEALKIILRSLLETMRKNEDGIVKDIDTEFLHDFRVAVRRTRSALTLIKGIFPESVKEKFKAEFAVIGRKSNELRDLDIYLLRREEYTGMLPPALRAGLDPLFEIIAREREEAHREFALELASDSYRRSIGAWEKFLNEPEAPGDALPGADAPVIGLAKLRIRKRYRKALKLGKGIDGSSSDRDLHTLRIECKKLRYYLEFFESLFPAGEIREVIRHLKALQDNLGDYNDMHMQQERLKGYISKINASENEGRESIAAAGGLISELYMKQKQIRSEFHGRFEEFAGEEMKGLFDNLFSGN